MHSLRLIGLLFILAARASHTDTAATPDALTGLWGCERVFGPAVHGELTVDGRGGEWHAHISGYAVTVRVSQETLTFVLPGGEGEFRGHFTSGRTGILGHWLQPQTAADGVRYASPVQLGFVQQGVWRGEVQPLEDRLSLYLALRRSEDGSLRAFIRNPERNWGMGHDYRVALEGTDLAFTGRQSASDVLRGRYDPQADTLSIPIPQFGAFTFTRRTPDTALGFSPTTPAKDDYVYRPPVVEHDGWKTASLSEAALETDRLTALVQRIRHTQTDGFTAPYIHGLLIARHGKLALEEYFYGFDKERTHDLRSASKTITGALVGIALDHSARFGLETPVYSLFPEYARLAHPDPRKQKITVRDLLSMNSGLACDENDDNSPGNEDTMQSQETQPDYYKYTLDLPMAADPGTGTAVYCSAGINLLGGVVRNATGTSLMDFFEQYYAGPLDIHTYHLNLSPTGDGYAGGGIYLRPRDALKLGQLYLSGGLWNGRRVLSQTWAARSIERHSTFPASDYAPAHDYGYTWHLHQVQVAGGTHGEYVAEGNGGQLVIVIPDLDVVVLFTAGNYGNFPTWRKYFEELVPQYIIPAAMNAPRRPGEPSRSP
jgi:CubicO group peptidase (beta-lactamase class C family)